MTKPVLVIGAATESGAMRPASWARLVDALLGTEHEWLLHEIKAGNVLHFDMDVLPARGDALDHFDKASAVVGDHLYFDTYEPYRRGAGFYYNVKNNEIIDRAERAGVPLFLIGDYPTRARKPDEKGIVWRLYRPRARKNPLASWKQQWVPEKISDIDPPLRVAYMPNAEERYRKAYARTKMPIHVTVGGWTPYEERVPGALYLAVPRMLDDIEDDDDAFSAAAEQLYGVSEDEVLRRGGQIDPQKVRNAVFKARKPGDVSRVTPLLPFNLLHRDCDEIQSQLMRSRRDFQRSRDVPERTIRTTELLHQLLKNMRRLDPNRRGWPLPPSRLTTFVDTQAGRLGALTDPSQAVSDLFALYVKTGRIGWKPEAAIDSRERAISQQIMEKLPLVLDRLIAEAVHPAPPKQNPRRSAKQNPRNPRRPVKTNPLVGWDYVGRLFEPGEIDRATKPMFSQNAPQVYAEKLKTTKLDIHVVIGQPTTIVDVDRGGDAPAQELAEKTAAQGRTVLWLQKPLSALFGENSDEVMRRPRGVFNRVSPMTPFTLLHRMGDAIRRLRKRDTEDIGHALDYAAWLLKSNDPSWAPTRLFNAGVDTVAGRNGWFASWGEATSDLWAKYLLTGRIAYDPDAGGTWTNLELSARRDYARWLDYYFPLWHEQAHGRIFVISE